MNLFELIHRLERTVKQLAQNPTPKIATIREVDCFGEAEWNKRKFIPAVLVDVVSESGAWLDYNVPCRVKCFGANKNAGIWLPPTVGMRVPLYFFGSILSPYVDLNGFYSDKFALPPDEATETNMVIKHGNHVIILDTEDGENHIKIKHESGTETIFKDNGDLDVVIKGNLEASIGGSLAVKANEVSIHGNLYVELSSDNRITLKTAGMLRGILTEATHPVCHLMGTPITGHPDIQGG